MRLTNKIALVTGGSQGIGKAICHAYAREGAKVIIINKNHPEAGQRVAQAIKKAGGEAVAKQCDVANEEQVKALIQNIDQEYGNIDILVNNAAIAVFKKFEDHSLEDWNRVMDVNLKGPFLMSREVIPLMKKQKYGKIIFVASTAASIGYPMISVYSATKGALVAMTKSMVTEVSRYNINVNILSPGSTDTPQNAPFINDPEFIANLFRRTASQAPMEPENMAGAAVFLASDESQAVHGLDLRVDNGWMSF